MLWDYVRFILGPKREKEMLERYILYNETAGFEELHINNQKVIGNLTKIEYYVLLGVVIFKISIKKYYTSILNKNIN